MKKLMIAAALALAAACSQAAVADWNASTLYTINANGTATSSANGQKLLAYLFIDKSDTALASTISTIAGDLAKGDFTSLTGYADTKTNWKDGTPTGSYVNQFVVYSDNADKIQGLDAAKYYAQMVVFNAETTDGATYFYTSNVKDATLSSDSPTTFSFGNQKSNGNMNATTAWTAIAAPEPTSGLLLLLGVAGLALRRRRA